MKKTEKFHGKKAESFLNKVRKGEREKRKEASGACPRSCAPYFIDVHFACRQGKAFLTTIDVLPRTQFIGVNV